MKMPGWAVGCWKKLNRWLEQLSSTSRMGVLALIFAVSFGLVEFLMHLKDARELMTSFLLIGLNIEPEPHKIEIRSWLFLAVATWMFLSFVFFLLWVRAELLRGQNDHTERTLRGVMRAAGHICRRLFPQGDLCDLTIEKIHFTYQIHKDFTTQVRRVFHIRAGKSPVYFIERGFRVLDQADPAESLIDIDFQVRDVNDPHGVVYLPMINESRNKSACIFFLPRIEPEQVRTIEISYKWPRMARALKTLGEEEFATRSTSSRGMIEFCMEIYLEPGSGGELSWEECGLTVPNKILCESESQLGWPGVKFIEKDIPPEIANAGIRLRLRWKTY
jgi:hypothetical protein